MYRLIHKAVADALAKDVEDAWIAIADALIEDIGGDDWLMVDPYLRRHAAQHAFLADQRQADAFAQFDIVSGTSTGLRFDALITQPGFLAVAEPEHLLPLIPYARSSDAITARGLYWLASHDLRAMTPLERWSRLHLQALVQDWEDRDGFAPPALAPWRTSWRWSTSRPPTPNMRLAGHTKAVLAITTGRLGNKEIVASGSEDGTVRLWDLNSGMPIGAPLVGNGSPIRAVVIGEVDGKTIVASGSKDGAIRLWDAKTGGLVGEPLAGHDPHPVNAIAFGKIRERPVFASAGDDAAIRLWDAATGASIGEPLRAHRLWIWTVEMGQMDGRSVIASGGADREVRIWDAATGDQLVEPIAFRGERVPSLALGEFDGAPLLAVVDVSDVFELIELQSGKSITYLTMPDADKICLRSVRATTHLAMASARKFTVVTVSRGGTGKLETHFLDEVVAEEGMLNCIALGDTHDRAVPVSGGRDAMVRLWDISTTRRSAEPPEQQSRLFTAIAAATVEGTDVIVAGGADGIVRFWDAFSGDLVGDPFSGGSLPEDESDPELPRCTWIDRVALHRLGERDLLVAQDGWLRVWATAPGLPRDAPLLTIGSSPSCFVLGESRGRPVLVIGTTGKRTGMMYRDPGIVEVRDLDTGHLSCEPINGHDDAITAVAISEIDGRTVIASAALDRTIRLWDAVTGRPLSPAIIVPEKTVTQLAFGRTGDRPLLISGDDGGGVRWWEPATGEPIETAGRELLGRHEDAVSAIVFATLKDRPVVVSGGKDCVVGVWDASSGARLCAIPTGKPVTAVEIDKHGNVVARLANSDLVAFEIRL